MTRVGDFFAALPDHAEVEIFDEILSGPDLKIERIVSYGQASPPGFWYDQESHEWVMVVRGRAGLQFEEGGEIVELGPGEYLNIAARERHRVAWTSADEPTVWLAVHYATRSST